MYSKILNSTNDSDYLRKKAYHDAYYPGAVKITRGRWSGSKDEFLETLNKNEEIEAKEEDD